MTRPKSEKLKKFNNFVMHKTRKMYEKFQNDYVASLEKDIIKYQKKLSFVDDNVKKRLLKIEESWGASMWGLWVEGNILIYFNGDVSTTDYIKRFKEKQNESSYDSFKLTPYTKKIDDIQSIGNVYNDNIYSLNTATEMYEKVISEIKLYTKHVERFSTIINSISIPQIKNMSAKSLISYFKERKMEISIDD